MMERPIGIEPTPYFLGVRYINSFSVLGNAIRLRWSWNGRTIAECSPGIVEEPNES
jgi:hypothetical protein